jgi:wyosine [tRNA(Phe)-imidazoG37] synthetase (radical SAM superfamily)
MKYRYLFGPVPSRRLGTSLGVDIIPFKTCTFNCIYCECGKTTNLTTLRKPYFKYEDIIRELDDFLSSKPDLDYITFAGSGEPTLNSDTGKIIRYLKENYPEYRIAMLTNGSLLMDRLVRDDIKDCDLIIPSLDAVSQEVYEKINRPCTDIKVEDVIKGIELLRSESKAEIWIEVFIVPGVNDTREELDLMRDVLVRISPDRIQLNTLDRPGTEDWLVAETEEKLMEIQKFFKGLNVEIIGGVRLHKGIKSVPEDITEKILSNIRRRPCTIEDLSHMLALNINVIDKYLQELEKCGKITSERKTRGVFYKIKT